MELRSPDPNSPMRTPVRTPRSSRSYLMFQNNVHNSGSGTVTPNMRQEHSASMISSKGVIYGTTIDTHEVLLGIERFFKEFEAMDERMILGQLKEISTKRIYFEDMKTLLFDEERVTFRINASHLMEYDREMYYQLIYFPAEMISCFDMALKNVFQQLYTAYEPEPKNQVRYRERMENMMIEIECLNDVSTMRGLNHDFINRLISFKGIVIRTSEIQPEMKAAFFRCCLCQLSLNIFLENARVVEPKQCSGCKAKSSMEIVHNRCSFTDKQFIKIQELPEYVADGETPQSMNLVAYDGFVERLKPGDRAEIVGVYRAQPLRVQKSKRLTKSVFNIYVDLISSKIIMDDRYKVNDKIALQFSDDQTKSFFEAARDPNIMNRLVESFAPSIFGCEDIKKGILALLFSGAQKKFSESGNGKFRSDINICLVGDPSTAKSQLLQQVHKIAPRGIYTSGRGSSAVGLTANVKKDPQTREFILESGALVMSDMGVCCIDQFDKMDDNNKTILLEVMEQQTISVAKAGIVCSLKSRTSILAAANPVNSRYNSKKSVVQNINLPPSLLSRFDLIYIMLDRAIESYDIKLAHHILSLYSGRNSEDIHQGYFTREFLTNYITFAKLYINPKLTEAASDKLSQAYVKMRSVGMSRKVISATPRQLESLIRISESIAKMRLSKLVEESDVNEAIALMRIATQQSATDPTTGCIDMDVLVTGRTAAFRSRINIICQKLKEHIKSNVTKYRKGVNYQFLTDQVKLLCGDSDTITFDLELKQSLLLLVSEDVLVTYGPNKNKPSVKLCKDRYNDK